MRPRRSRPLFIIDIARAARRRSRRRRTRPGVPLQHRRPADDREGKPGAARRRARARRVDRRRGSRAVHGLDAVARGGADGGRAARSASRRSGRRSSSAWSRRWPACRPKRASASTRVTRLIVEKLLLTPTEQLKALSDEAIDAALCGRAEPVCSACRTTGSASSDGARTVAVRRRQPLDGSADDDAP